MLRRTLLLLVLATGLAGGLLASAPLALAARQKPGPVVQFHSSGLVLGCTSTPDRVSVRVGRGQWLNVINRTGADAAVVVADHRLPVADGRGRALRLRPGRYEVSIQPSCLAHAADAQATTVDVTGDPASSPTTSPDPDSGQPGSVNVGTVVRRDGLLEELFEPPADPKLPSVSLLGVIAAICVFGVTASTIRAILAQRAARTVAKHRLIR